MKNILRLSIALLLAIPTARAEDISQPMTYYFKVSKALTGMPPNDSDRLLFQTSLQKGQGDAFIQEKIQSLVKSAPFAKKLKYKIDELFRMDTTKPVYRPGSYDGLITEMLANNSSWDSLLSTKHYKLSVPNGNFNDTSDFFYDTVLNDSRKQQSLIDFDGLLTPPSSTQSPSKSDVSSIQFSEGDLRIAGIITTPRFFGRYGNTALNKNRRRAAALFRIFLCDSMAPAVPAADAASEDKDFLMVIPDHKTVSEDQIRQAVKDPHGQQADCKACHFKLDPLGQVFGLSAAGLSPDPSPGALRFSGADRRKVDIPLRGLGDLPKALTSQPEYVSCQVRHFVDWYLGRDIPLTREKEAALVAKFNEVGRKPQEFVAHLLTLPEFRHKPQVLTEDQLLARRVVGILKNCNSCHQNLTDTINNIETWDLTSMPYGQNPAERKWSIDILRENLDTANDGAKRQMPPKRSPWQLSKDEYQLLKKWLDRGAPDYSGKAQVQP